MLILADELLKILEEQNELIKRQDELIEKLVKDNLEKENMISELGRVYR